MLKDRICEARSLWSRFNVLLFGFDFVRLAFVGSVQLIKGRAFVRCCIIALTRAWILRVNEDRGKLQEIDQQCAVGNGFTLASIFWTQDGSEQTAEARRIHTVGMAVFGSSVAVQFLYVDDVVVHQVSC